ncbi:MAG: BACON domain-containing protein, partial [Candidatus Sumerlaeota bacterium]
MKKSMLTQTLGAFLLLLITASLAQAAPQLVVRPGSLSATADYGTNPSTQSLTVANGQDDELNYNIATNYITPSTGWLDLSRDSGQLTGNTTHTITVSYDLRPGGVFIGVGTHQAQFEVTSNGGNQTVNVTLTVLDQATMDVTPTTLTVMTYEGYSTTSQVTITNTGESALHYLAITRGTYAYATPAIGTVPGSSSLDLDVVFNNPPSFSPGIYSSGTLTLYDPYAVPTTQTVDLVMEVRPDVSPLQVFIKPTAAANAGAQWRRVGTEIWYDSGEIEAGVDSGPQAIEFRDITGWQTSQNITLGVRGRDIPETATGTYFINQYTVSYGAQANGYIS